MKQPLHQVKFHSSMDALNKGFDWAKDMALSYVREGYPVGPCYESALPGRDAFCMRDVSHQALGAHFLGLQEHNRSIMNRFAENISESKDWCSYWEINLRNEPCPADYKSDTEFWYNLPANFDVLVACGRLMEWTGDRGYLTDPQMANFHRLSMHEYVKRWDRDGDGLVDRVDSEGCRGIASYDEGDPYRYTAAADTVALEVAAYREAARMYRYLGEADSAAEMAKTGETIAETYRNGWWNEAENHYDNILLPDGTTGGKFTCIKAGFPLRYGLITDPEKLAAQLDYVVEHTPELNIEDQTYIPEILWQYGRNDDALKLWLHFADESCARREYPEVSYAMVETLVSGFLGLGVSAEKRSLRVDPAVPAGEWAEANDIPLWDGALDLRVEGGKGASLTNRTGHALIWTAGGRTVAVLDGGTASLAL